MSAQSRRRAVVLGGGGPHGRAWEVGLLKGLKDEGIDLNEADLIVGTSAGSIVGSQIRSGRNLDELYQAALATPPGDPRLSSVGGPPDQQAFEEITRMWQGGAEMTPERVLGIGKRALAVKGIVEDVAVRDRAASIGITEWPRLPLKLAAANVFDGTVRFFDQAQGVPIERAIAASTSVPGWYEPITVGDARYMDGGVRGLNLEAVSGYEVVVVIAPAMSPARKEEVEKFRAEHGCSLFLIGPDEDARSIPGEIPGSAEGGLLRSKRVALQVRSIWQPAVPSTK